MAFVPSTLVCSRCQAHGHVAKDCKKPFLRLRTLAEEREQLRKEREARKEEYERKKAEYEAKKAEYEAKKADREARQAAFQQRRAARAAANKWEYESNCTESTAVTSGNEEVDEAEVEKWLAWTSRC